MDRLTFKVSTFDGKQIYNAVDNDWVDNHKSEKYGVQIGAHIDRLAELEDKLEDGLMIELPCKIGDTVWCTTSDQYDYINEPIECEVSCILNYEKIWIFEINSKIREGGWGTQLNFTLPSHMNKRRLSDFNKTVFLSKSEAELELERRTSNA